MVSVAVAILLGPLIPGIVLIAVAASRRDETKPSRLMLLGVRTLIVGVLVSGFLIVSLSRG
jgi:hypothetical protein